MTGPRRYRKRPVQCDAFQLNQYGDFARAVEWINSNGGRAHHFKDAHGADVVAIFTIDGNLADVHEGWYVVRGGLVGEFYPCRGDIFEASHEALEEPVRADSDQESPTGLYVSRGDPGATGRLVGGAALQLPHD